MLIAQREEERQHVDGRPHRQRRWRVRPDLHARLTRLRRAGGERLPPQMILEFPPGFRRHCDRPFPRWCEPRNAREGRQAGVERARDLVVVRKDTRLHRRHHHRLGRTPCLALPTSESRRATSPFLPPRDQAGCFEVSECPADGHARDTKGLREFPGLQVAGSGAKENVQKHELRCRREHPGGLRDVARSDARTHLLAEVDPERRQVQLSVRHDEREPSRHQPCPVPRRQDFEEQHARTLEHLLGARQALLEHRSTRNLACAGAQEDAVQLEDVAAGEGELVAEVRGQRRVRARA